MVQVISAIVIGSSLILSVYTWCVHVCEGYVSELHMCVKVNMHMYACLCEGQRSILGIVPQAAICFLFETRSLTGLELTK